MKQSDKVKWILHKRCFDLGLGLTNYLKLVIAVIGIGSFITGNKIFVGVLLVGYAIFCYCFGRLYIYYGWYGAEIEVNNQYDPFVKQMRKTKLLNSRTSKKKHGI